MFVCSLMNSEFLLLVDVVFRYLHWPHIEVCVSLLSVFVRSIMSSFGWLCLINSHSLPYSLFRSLQLSEEAAKKENELNELEEDMERLRNRLQQPSENYQDEVTNLYQSSQNHSLGEKKASQKLLKFEDILSRIRHHRKAVFAIFNRL